MWKYIDDICVIKFFLTFMESNILLIIKFSILETYIITTFIPFLFNLFKTCINEFIERDENAKTQKMW